MYKTFLISFLFLIPFSAFSQNIQKIDSLLRVLKQHDGTKEEQILLLNEVANTHPNINESSVFLNKALRLAIEIDNPILEAQTLEEISYVNNRLGNTIKALEAAFKALKIYESKSLVDKQAASYAQIADLYLSENDYTEAITYLKKVQEIYATSGDAYDKMLISINLGEAYRLFGDLKNAEIYFLKVLELNKTIKEVNIEGYTLGNLGMVYNAQEKLDIAQDYLEKSIRTLHALNDAYASSIYLAELASIYEKQRKPILAEQKLIEAFEMAKKAGLKEQIRDFSKQLATFYKKDKQYEKALTYQLSFQIYQDSLVNKEIVKKIEQVKSKHEIDKRESEIRLLNTINTNQKYTVIGLIAGLTLLVLLFYFLYKGNKKIKRTNLLLTHQKDIISKREQEKIVLLRELNHRTKNNLQMISSLLNLQSSRLTGHPAKEAILAGKDRVEALSLIHKKLYQEGVDSKIMITEYIEELVSSLFYGYDVDFVPKLEIPNISIHIDIAVPLALIINELIINALKYAYIDIEKPELHIIINEEPNYLQLDIIDNGTGFDHKKVTTSHSFGLDLLNTLVKQLKGSIEKKQKKGTHWSIKIKRHKV
ncbi:tetratricopeptide repeat-containing sensor histidine kinase [Kordia sp.]|uniref:tetratricopeptide repeat-containing sensor histidine kinase n=1 Tax=Kordia sp. TaxID=1965332 RepID=UPI003D6A87BE